MSGSTLLRFLDEAKKEGMSLKVFVDSGSGQPKTMLQGQVTDFDEEAIVLNKCLIFMDRIISMTPFE